MSVWKIIVKSVIEPYMNMLNSKADGKAEMLMCKIPWFLFLPIQEEQLSITGESMHKVLVYP